MKTSSLSLKSGREPGPSCECLSAEFPAFGTESGPKSSFPPEAIRDRCAVFSISGLIVSLETGDLVLTFGANSGP